MGVGVDVKYVMGFFVWMLYTCFQWIYCKECRFLKNGKLGFMSSYWEFWDFDE